jgi:hypothetical protein
VKLATIHQPQRQVKPEKSMAKYKLSEGIIDTFINTYVKLWRTGQIHRMKSKLRNDPEMVKILGDLDRDMQRVKTHLEKMSSDPEFQDFRKKYLS